MFFVWDFLVVSWSPMISHSLVRISNQYLLSTSGVCSEVVFKIQ